MATHPKPVKLKSGAVRWRVQFRERPGSSVVSETFTSQDAALRFIEIAEDVGWQAARELRRGGSSESHIPTLATWLETHLTNLGASATPGTVDDYRRMAKRTWLTRLGRMPLDMLTRQQVIDWVAWQRQQETHASRQRRAKAAREGRPLPPAERVSAKSISNAQRLLSSVLESATERHGTPNVARGVALPSDDVAAEMTFLTVAEYGAIYAEVPERWQPFVALLAGTGARWGEATALRGADFDLDAEQPSVRIARAWKRDQRGGVYLGSTKSRKGRRSVSLSPSTVAAIREQVEAAALDELVFTADKGGRVMSQNFHPRVWRPAVEASGIGKRPRVHDLRHSHVSWLIHQGVPLPIIQERLGHESIKTTVDRYGHILPESHAVAAAAVERAMASVEQGGVFAGELEP